MRSARTTDVVLTANLNRPLFAFSGANAGVLRQIRAANLVDLGRDVRPDLYRGERDPRRLHLDARAVRGHPRAAAGPPRAPLRLRRRTPPGAEAAGATASYGSSVDTTGPVGRRESGGWVRTQDGAPTSTRTGPGSSAANVVFQIVEYQDSGFRDITGAPSPEAVLVGEGEVWVLTGGRLVRGAGRGPTPEDVTTLTTTAGQPLTLQPGRTWVELVPPGVGRRALTVQTDRWPNRARP